MLYLTGCIPAKPHLQHALLNAGVGALLTPISQRTAPSAEWTWAADNGCFNDKWDYKTWLTWLTKKANPESALLPQSPMLLLTTQAQ